MRDRIITCLRSGTSGHAGERQSTRSSGRPSPGGPASTKRGPPCVQRRALSAGPRLGGLRGGGLVCRGCRPEGLPHSHREDRRLSPRAGRGSRRRGAAGPGQGSRRRGGDRRRSDARHRARESQGEPAPPLRLEFPESTASRKARARRRAGVPADLSALEVILEGTRSIADADLVRSSLGDSTARLRRAVPDPELESARLSDSERSVLDLCRTPAGDDVPVDDVASVSGAGKRRDPEVHTHPRRRRGAGAAGSRADLPANDSAAGPSRPEALAPDTCSGG